MEELLRSAANGLFLPQRLFNNNAVATVANTVTKTSIIPAGQGSLYLPPNFFNPLNFMAIRRTAAGYYNAPIAATATIESSLGGTALASVATNSLANTTSNYSWFYDELINCFVSGASGTFWTRGVLTYEIAGGVMVSNPFSNGTSAVTVDTTVDNLLDLAVTWDTNTSTRSWTTTNFQAIAV